MNIFSIFLIATIGLTFSSATMVQNQLYVGQKVNCSYRMENFTLGEFVVVEYKHNFQSYTVVYKDINSNTRQLVFQKISSDTYKCDNGYNYKIVTELSPSLLKAKNGSITFLVKTALPAYGPNFKVIGLTNYK